MRNINFSQAIGLMLIAIWSSVAYANDDMTKIAPNNVKVLFENDRVRVLETPSKPGETIPMHTHSRPRVVYFMNPVSEKITQPGKEAQVYNRQSGEVAFHEAESLTVENVGSTEGRNIVVELK
ncbi:MAG TPA: hypothetical protein VNW52_13245 [Burkholderiaceae bacterium]|jgi:hypothetical protein|nr:hypothetical protein [Burkholderiaceae bacterium]